MEYGGPLRLAMVDKEDNDAGAIEGTGAEGNGGSGDEPDCNRGGGVPPMVCAVAVISPRDTANQTQNTTERLRDGK
jgi:hypothetical protein